MLDLENASNVGQPGLYQFSVRNGAAVVAASVDDVSVQEGNGPGNTIIVVTHEEKVALHSRRIVRILDGNIASDETVRKVESRESRVEGKTEPTLDPRPSALDPSR